MILNLKVVSLAAMAALAVSATLASAAFGHSPAQFHAASAPVNLTGWQVGTQTFKTDPGTVHCSTAAFAGSQSASTATSVTITPAYLGCQLTSMFGNINVTIDFKGCDYSFNASGAVSIVCEAGEGPVTVSGPGCTMTMPAQTISPGVEYTNAGSGTTTELNVHTKAATINYSYSGFLCGSGSGTKTGTYSGLTTFTGANAAGAHVAISRTATVP